MGAVIERSCACETVGGCPACSVVTVDRAAYLCQMPAWVIYRKAAVGQLPSMKIGGRVYLRELDVLQLERATRHAREQEELGKDATVV